MIKHVILWNHKEGFSETQKRKNAERIKESMERLKDLIPTVVSMRVEINPLKSSSAGIALISEFEDEAGLAVYQAHPEHKKAVEFIHYALCDRRCMDYIEE